LPLAAVFVTAAATSTAAANTSAIAGGYYTGIDPERGRLDLQLSELIWQRSPLSYPQIWVAFPDVYLQKLRLGPGREPCEGGLLGDVYSANCWAVGPVADGGDQCGNYAREGDCYNREHVWPISWWGGSTSATLTPHTDLHALWPSDGYVNGMRANWPFCELDVEAEPVYVSTNGCKLGQCDASQHDGRGFEVADTYKGDLARAIMYVSTAYLGRLSCCEAAGVDGDRLKPWMAEVLRRWHFADPPTPQEIAMNEEVWVLQHNRNPFIDHPAWADLVNFSAPVPPTWSPAPSRAG
jgi:endonuclease I